MKRNWRLLACLFALPALPLLAAEPETQETALEVQETAAQFANKKTTPVGTQKPSNQKAGMMPEEEAIQSMPVITPAVAPHVMDGSDTYVTLDFIWWKTFVGGMEYALSGVVDNGGFVTPFGASTGKGTVQKPGFEFQPGFKAGIGVNMDHDGWDVYAEYTYLSSESETNHLSASAGIGAVNIPEVSLNGNSLVEIPLVNASCNWKQNFSVINFELGRDYFVSRYLTLRPSAGLKTAWINEQSKVSYVPTTTVSTDGIAGSRPTAVLLTYRQNMWGLGIRTGLNAGWHVTKNWSFYNDFAFTALWSDFHIHQKQNLTETLYGAQTSLFTKESLQTVVPVLEAGLGLSYITWWEKSRYRFEFRAGWEEQIWLDFNHFMTLGGTGNLTVQGLTIKGILNF